MKSNNSFNNNKNSVNIGGDNSGNVKNIIKKEHIKDDDFFIIKSLGDNGISVNGVMIQNNLDKDPKTLAREVVDSFSFDKDKLIIEEAFFEENLVGNTKLIIYFKETK